jgi:hypothetical protein
MIEDDDCSDCFSGYYKDSKKLISHQTTTESIDTKCMSEIN